MGAFDDLVPKKGAFDDLVPQQQVSPAVAFQDEHPFLRTAGRGVRNVASGVAGMADVALLAPKTLVLGAGLATGSDKLKNFGMIPSMRESTQEVIDEATGDRLKPIGNIDKLGDFASELTVPLMGFGQAKKVAGAAQEKAPKIADAIRGVINPAEPITNAAAKGLPPVLSSGPAQKQTAEQVRKSAGKLYKEAESKGGVLKPDVTNRFVDDIEKMLPQTEKGRLLAGKDSQLTKIIERVKGFRDSPTTLDEIQELDEILGGLVEYDMGKMTKEGFKISQIQTALRNTVKTATEKDTIGGKEGFETLRNASKTWAQSLKLRDIEHIIEKTSDATNPSTAMKNAFRALKNNPNKMAFYTKTEQEAIRKAAETGAATELLNTFGSKLIPIAASVTGGASAGAGGSLAGAGLGYTASKASRLGANALQRTRADRVTDAILGQSSIYMPKEVSKTNQTLAKLLAIDLAAQQ